MKEYTLQHPIKSPTGLEIKEVKIRRPLTRDFRGSRRKGGNDPEEQSFHLTCLLCELGQEEVDLLDLADYAEIQNIIQGFLPTPKE